jgi:IS5 family transposase
LNFLFLIRIFQEVAMTHGLFDLHIQLQKIDQNGDPLTKINQLIDWELFRKDLEKAREQARTHEPKSNAGRKPIDVILIFKMLVLQSLYNLSDEATEQQCLDRLSFQRFLGLAIGESVPDKNTLWLFKEMLKPGDLAKVLFRRFDDFLRNNGFEAQQGQIVDANIVRVRIRRDTPEVNKQVKAGDGGNVTQWSEPTRKQKDIDARWTKKNNKSHFGYKDHESVDVKHKLIRAYTITSAEVHDSRVYEELLTPNDSVEEYADSAYRSEARMDKRILDEKIPRFQEKGTRGHPLTDEQKSANRERSRVRSRVEHVFGAKVMRAGNMIVRTIGLARAKVKLGLRNLVYNLERYAMLKLRSSGGVVS